MVKALFFDAGNTLVFADTSKTLAPLHSMGIRPSREQLFAAECAAKLRRDDEAAQGAKLADRDYWDIFYSTLLAALEEDERAQAAIAGADRYSGFQMQIKQRLVRKSQAAANWELVVPGTREVLMDLRTRYRLAVISNSDGHMASLIARVGLGDCFEVVIDSGIVGHQKPDVRIFQAGLSTLGVGAVESLYIGDIYSVDYTGAQAAGMQALLFDACGAYRERGLPRVENMAELHERLM